MAHTTDTMRAALQPTGKFSPLIPGAVARTVERREELAAIASADRHIARAHPAVAAFLAEGRASDEQLLTPAQTTLTFDEGLAAHRTTPIETALRDIDCEADSDDLPWLAAEIVVLDDKPQAYGRKTMVWLHNGATTGELVPERAREALAAMREFANRYEALLDLADETAAGDFAGDPEIARLDREAEDRRIRAITEARA